MGLQLVDTEVNNLIEKLKQIREKHNYSGSDVANIVGITKGYYSLIENGKRGLSYPLAVKIAAVFNLKPDDIFLSNEFTNEKLDKEKEVAN